MVCKKTLENFGSMHGEGSSRLALLGLERKKRSLCWKHMQLSELLGTWCNRVPKTKYCGFNNIGTDILHFRWLAGQTELFGHLSGDKICIDIKNASENATRFGSIRSERPGIGFGVFHDLIWSLGLHN